MDFFHCMCCGHWPLFQPENRMRYFFSSCRRLFCEKCLVALKMRCMCQSEYCRLVELQPHVGKDVKEFFMDPMSLFRDAVQKPLSVMQFQSNMQKSCIRNFGKVLESNKALKTENGSLKNQIGTLKLENDHLRQRLESANQQIHSFKRGCLTESRRKPRYAGERTGQVPVSFCPKRRDFFCHRARKPSPATSFGTTFSSNNAGTQNQSPFVWRNRPSSSRSWQTHSSGRTPEIINRLHNLKCEIPESGTSTIFRTEGGRN